jgi:anti-sigma factor RsiW
MQAQLAAFADGSLPSSRRTRLLADVQEHPDLAEGLQRQREAVEILRSLEQLAAPVPLQRSIESLSQDAAQTRRRHARSRRRALLPAIVLAGACAAALAIAIPLVGEAQRAPTVLQASRLALRPATLAAPQESSSDGEALDVSVGGLHFPYWQRSLGWQAIGARHDRLAGRAVTTVYYGSHSTPAWQGRLAYAIVGGKALAQPGGTTIGDHGVQFQVLDLQGATVVTWRRAGHTCIIVARRVPVRTLVHLASWQ